MVLVPYCRLKVVLYSLLLLYLLVHNLLLRHIIILVMDSVLLLVPHKGAIT